MSDQDAQQKAFAAIVANSWSDADFRAQLVADPTATLKANGVDVPEGKRVVVVEDSDTEFHIVLPTRPAELSDEELDSVAGGWFSYPCHDMDPK